MSVKRIEIAEFRRLGYLQEVNRRFFHPLGLALEIVVEGDGAEVLGGVWDCREDAEGVYLDAVDGEKAARISGEWERRRPAREEALGFMVQPVGEQRT